jgi:hypothetical protein
VVAIRERPAHGYVDALREVGSTSARRQTPGTFLKL